MKTRVMIIVLLLALDALVLPAAVRLPDYLPLGREASGLDSWQRTWLMQPMNGVRALVRPGSPPDHQARNIWLWLQVFVGLGALLVLWPGNGSLGFYRRDGMPNPDRNYSHGSANWRTQKAVEETMQTVAFRNQATATGFLAGADREKNPTRAYMVHGPTAKGAKTNPHVLILGGSGAGKTRRLVLPNLWLLGEANKAGNRNSMVITDPKGELYSFTAEHFRQLGYRVETLNLIYPKRSSRYNPLSEIADNLERGDASAASDAAWELAHAFTAPEAGAKEDPFWTNAGQSIIASSVLYVAARAPAGQKTMASAYRLITELGQDGGQMLDSVFRAISDLADPARLAYGVTALSSDKTRAGILTTAAVSLRLFADPSVAAMTSHSDYSLGNIGTEPTVVYLLLPDDKSGKNAVAALYLQQLYSALSRQASISPGGRLPVPVYFLLDEFANIGKFKDFDKMISVMRGRGMSAMIVLQALQQLAARYDKETAAVIAANCDTWLFLRTNDFDTAEQISKKIGQCTIRTRTRSSNQQDFKSTMGENEQLSARSLMSPDEVLRWPMGQVLIMQAGQLPAQLALSDISQWPVRFKEGGPPEEREDAAASQAPWLPRMGFGSSHGVGAALAAPVLPGMPNGPDRLTSTRSLLERLRKGGDADGGGDSPPSQSDPDGGISDRVAQ